MSYPKVPTRHRRAHAFTLIELLIVVAIIAILAAIAVPNFLEAQTRAKVSRSLADMRAVTTGLEAYSVDYNSYPPTLLDGRQNVMRMMMGDMPFVPYVLTTPIAYMTAVPLDHFKPRIMEDHQHSFMYFNATNTPDAENRARYRALVESRTHMGAATLPAAPSWFLVSVGPDLQMGTMATQLGSRGALPIYQIMTMPMGNQMGSPVQYDPTNGTISAGDIVRFGP